MQFYYAHILCIITVDASQANDTNKLQQPNPIPYAIPTPKVLPKLLTPGNHSDYKHHDAIGATTNCQYIHLTLAKPLTPANHSEYIHQSRPVQCLCFHTFYLHQQTIQTIYTTSAQQQLLLSLFTFGLPTPQTQTKQLTPAHHKHYRQQCSLIQHLWFHMLSRHW